MYAVGDYAFDTNINDQIQVLEVSDIWGFVSYKVYHTTSGTVYMVPEEQLSIAKTVNNFDLSYLRYVTLLEKIKNETAEGILSNLSSGIIPLPHQLHVLNKVMSTNNVRYILADEVGLGKTIEAGLTIKELKTRGLVKRVLIVCPTGLVTQWKQEMQEKFDEKFHVILPEDYDTIRKITDNEDVYGQFDQVISPMDAIKPLDKRAGWTQEKIDRYNEERIYSIINSGWDAIIIDEAHRVAGSSGEVARYKLGKLLADASPYLLLLTATPHNGKTEPFLRLVRLVDEKAFPSMKAVVKEQVAPYIIRTEKREAIDNNGNKLFKHRSTHIVELHWDEKHSLQQKMYELVSDYVSKNYNKAMRSRGKNMWFVFLLIMMQRLVSSSTAAIHGSMKRRVQILEEQAMRYQSMTEEEFAEMELEENMDDALLAMSVDVKDEINQLQGIISVAQQAEYQHSDVKIEPLIEILEELFMRDNQQKVIIFTEFVATQDYLKRLLEEQEYEVSILNGSMNMDERNEVLKKFKQKSDVLISTDAGGEGLNLQFSNCVINFDLPWNPMKIEQRIGRVDRIGQQRDVMVYNFVLADTIESRVRDVLEEKLSVILEEIGIDKYSDVLDSETTEVNYTDAYMSSVRDPKYIDVNVAPIEKDLKKQIQQSIAVKDLIKEEKDLKALIGKENSFDLDKALRLMVTYYENLKGNPYLAIDNYGINDSLIIKHLNRNIIQDRNTPVISASIEDFSNEEGYFMLWKLSVSEHEHGKRVIPIFINKEGVLRPLAGKRIWEAFLDEHKHITVKAGSKLTEAIYKELSKSAQEFTYDTFLELTRDIEKRNEEKYRKYMYALKIRTEAAEHIGIDNIKQHKLLQLAKEKESTEQEYRLGKVICPEFTLILMVEMEK